MKEIFVTVRQSRTVLSCQQSAFGKLVRTNKFLYCRLLHMAGSQTGNDEHPYRIHTQGWQTPRLQQWNGQKYKCREGFGEEPKQSMNNIKVTTLAKNIGKNFILIWEWHMKLAGISVQCHTVWVTTDINTYDSNCVNVYITLCFL